MIEPSLQSRRKFLQNVGYISVSFSLFDCIGKADPAMAARVDYLGDLPRVHETSQQSEFVAGSVRRRPGQGLYLVKLNWGKVFG